jgi:hypothetical protein
MPVSPTLAPAVIDRHRARDPRTGELVPDPELEALSAAVGRARSHAEQLEALAETLRRDPTRTPEGAAVELARTAPLIGERAAAALDQADTRLAGSVAQLGAVLAGPPLGVHAAMEPEIRARLAAMSSETRRTALLAAIEAGDELTAGAALRGPAMLVGMAPSELEHIRQAWGRARHPEKVARLAVLQKARADAERAGAALVALVGGLTTTAAATADERATAATAALTAARSDA